MKRLLIVYHSMTSGTTQMARAAAVAARAETETTMLHVDDAGPAEVLAADGYIFATPENLAAISGKFKHFIDRCYYPVLGRIEGRPYCSLICAGSDGSNAASQLARICTGWRLRAIADPLIVCTHAQTPEQILALKHIDAAELARCAERGAAMAAGLAMGVF
jgi:multimeric flavodoxin WrbA